MSKCFEIDKHGICSTCKKVPLANDHLKCRKCDEMVHVLCPNISPDQKIAFKSTVSGILSPSTKQNILFFCDVCLTEFEIEKASDTTKKVDLQETKVTNMDKKLEEITALLKKNLEEKLPVGNGTAWADKVKIQPLKNSDSILVAKLGNTAEEYVNGKNKIEDVIVRNKCAVKNAYKNKAGELVMVCDTEESCSKLKTLVTDANMNFDVSSPTPKLKSISIVGLSSEYSSEEFMELIVNQNSWIKEMCSQAKFEEHFKFRAIKTLKNDETMYQVFCSVSQALFQAIKERKDRVYRYKFMSRL